MGDKDMGIRPFFRHLAAQGRVIVDIAYRLSPEASTQEVVYDAKRAVAWIKANAAGAWILSAARAVDASGGFMSCSR